MKNNLVFASAALVFAMSLTSISADAQVVLNVDAGMRGPAIGATHYGIFFEEINHAGDGGLYAELIQNRSFEDNASATAWSAIGSASIKVVSDGDLLTAAQTRALEAQFTKAGDGISNSGFWGINVVKGTAYKLSLWIESNASVESQFTAQLLSNDGKNIGEASLSLDSNNSLASKNWRHYTAQIVATDNDAKGKFALIAKSAQNVRIDVVSLFPPTYKDRPNGCRPDLAQMLADMKPAFMRFPGGCFVEGGWQNNKTNRFEWKNTIGAIEERPGHYNVNWKYNCSDGLGFHEMLQLSEDLGAEPLFVVNIGLGHGWMVDYRTELDEYIQEALDAIEYCNGSTDTKWGAIRAANGHPEPFNLRLIEIGNENYNFSFSNNNDQSDHYAERYKKFYDAIKAIYPDMVMIGNVEAWGTDNPSWRNPYPVDAVDEHYYRNPRWFENQYSKYDSYDRSKHKVYVGEYAVTQDYGKCGNLDAALGEAVYMLGMENNSDVCVMNSYAPIFVNENDQAWMPDMIRFNSNTCYGTPSYYVQMLLPNNVGKQNVRWTEANNTTLEANRIGLSTWSTAAIFDNVKVTDANGNTLLADDFTASNNTWNATGGTWTVTGGQLVQSDQSMQGAVYYNNTEIGDNYTLELDATKTAGAEGFLIAFKYGDSKNYAWWNLGGWGNTQHAIESCSNGSKTTVVSAAGKLENNRTYKLKVVVTGAKVQCYMDGELMFDATMPIQRKVYFASSIDDDTKTLFVKIVNTSGNAYPTQIKINNAKALSGDAIVLSSASILDENTTDAPNKVVPETSALANVAESAVDYTAPAYSLSILKIKLDDINITTDGSSADNESVEALKSEIKPIMDKLNFMHTSLSLPTGTPQASIEWSFKETVSGYAMLGNSGWTQALDVVRMPDANAVTVGTLMGKAKFTDGTTATIEYPVTIAPEDDAYGYLYCYMNSSKEITNYALGTKESLGHTFNVLLNGNEIFDTEKLAEIEHGTRDAYLHKGARKDEYFITTTDMCNAKSGVWNNYGMNLLRSTDLIHWESTTFDFRKGKSVFSDPDATTDAYKTDAEYAKINRVWAPQFIYDKASGKYVVYYSLLSTNTGDNYDKIYYSYADADFKTLTQPRVFYDPGYAVIDADIVYSEYDGLYHMYYKREGAQSSDRGIWEATSPTLVDGTWTDIMHITYEGSELTEGSSALRRINEDFYNVYYMRYTGGSAYKVTVVDHAGLNPAGSFDVLGKGQFQHGSVITVTEKEYKVLEYWDEITSLIADAEAAQASGIKTYDEALVTAKTALAYTTVDALYTELPKAIDALSDAKNAHVASLLGENETDLTFLLADPIFSNGGNGWEGTSFTAVSNGVAEHFNKTFDTYQVLTNMPAGIYRFECQGFYRNGDKVSAYNAHENGTEQLLAELYINDAFAPLVSLYSSDKYTNNPYTFPDNMTTANTAFNSTKQYGDNSVIIVLKESGDIRLGVRKTTAVATDWTCFDNFKLFGSAPESGIATVLNSKAEKADVYSINGVLLQKGIDISTALRNLAPGIYVIGNQKIFIQ